MLAFRILSILCMIQSYLAFSPSKISAPKYNIDHIFHKSSSVNNDVDGLPIHRVLYNVDPVNFRTPSQAKRAVEYGRILVLRNGIVQSSIAEDGCIGNDGTLQLSTVANSTTLPNCNDMLIIRSRLPNEYYPQSVTKYVEPPSTFAQIVQRCDHPVVYEDSSIAIVNKPEGIDTIGEKRGDLQSALPFILRPPETKPNNRQKSIWGTSGCVLVAKSHYSMKYHSRRFAKRKIQKTYCAIVFGKPVINNDNDAKVKDYEIIDYPIDGKDAVTLWKVMTTVNSDRWGQLSMLHLVPKTGRYHQIRRHLSYCISCPIVGDPKYD